MNRLLLIIISISIGCSQDNILSSIIQAAESMNSIEQKNLNRAKSHEKVGLLNEADLIYNQLFNSNPSNTQIFTAYKNFLYKNNKYEQLIEISIIYSKSIDDNPYGMLALADSYLLVKDKKEAMIIFDILFDNYSSDIKKIKRFISKLIYHNETDYALKKISYIRKRYSHPDFYSMNLGSYYLSKMQYAKSLNEYLIYLENNPGKLDYIRKKLMSFPSEDETIKNIRLVLNENESNISKILLSEYEFKWGNYNTSCDLMINSYQSEKMLYDYGKNLIIVNELNNAERVFNHLTKSSDRAIVESTIFQLALLLEIKSNQNLFELPITNKVIRSSFFEIPDLGANQIDIESASIMNVVNIYDSLIIIYNNPEARFKLADLKSKSNKYRDELIDEFTYLEKMATSNSTKFNSAIKIIDIKILNNEIDYALIDLINDYKKKYKKNDQQTLLNLKINQVYFFLGDFDLSKENIGNILKTLSKDSQYYNDYLDGITLMMLFDNNKQELMTFSEGIYLLKTKNYMDGMTKFENLLESENSMIHNLALYYISYINIYLGKRDLSESITEKINGDDTFSQLIIIMWAEVDDYVNKDINSAIDFYLEFLETYETTIFYEDIRLRLREIAG